MPLLKRAALGLAIAATVVFSGTASPLPVISVCELIQHPDKWEGKIVTVRGAIPIRPSGEPSIDNISLFPLSSESCKYSDSKYISADEPAEVLLQIPDYHFRKNPPRSFAINDSAIFWASSQLGKIHKEYPSLRQAIVVVDGFISLRKINLRQRQREADANKRGRPKDMLKPVILTVESYRSVEEP
jgi:hypothetical protein